MSTFAIHDPRLDLVSVGRHRPTAGPAYEKRCWHGVSRSNPSALHSPLFSGPPGLALRPSFGVAPAVIELPTRITLFGTDEITVAARMLAETGGFTAPFRRCFAPGAAQEAIRSLLEDPSVAILAHESAPLLADPVRRPEAWRQPWWSELRSRLRDAASTDIEAFTRGVHAGRFLVCAVASRDWAVPGISLYGDVSLYDWVIQAAQELGVELTWTSPEAVRQQIDLGLPGWSELPVGGGEVIDVSGFNLSQLPAAAEAVEVDLSDTAVLDLTPLAAWPRLRKATLGNLWPLSIAPVLHLEALDFEASVLASTGRDAPTVRDLSLRGVDLPSLAPLRSWSDLTRLKLSGRKLDTFDGLEELGSIESLTLELETLPSCLDALAAVPDLISLRLRCHGELDVRRIPSLPRLRVLEISGLKDQPLRLLRPESLSRFTELEELTLRATDLETTGFLTDLPQLRHLSLESTNIRDAAELAALRRLRTLSLTTTYVTDLAPLAGLQELDHLAFSTMASSPPELRVLVSLVSLRRLELLNDCVDSLDVAGELPNLETLWVESHEVSDLRPLTDHPALTKLYLMCPALDDISTVAGLRLQELSLVSGKVSSITSLAQHGFLRVLHISGRAGAPLDVSPLASVPLRTLSLGRQVRGLNALAGLPLESLDLSDSDVTDCDVVGSLAGLRELNLSFTKAGSLAPLMSLEQLRTLDVSGTRVRSLSPLTSLRKLRSLEAWGLGDLESAAPLLSVPPLARLTLDARVAVPLEPALGALHNLEVRQE